MSSSAAAPSDAATSSKKVRWLAHKCAALSLVALMLAVGASCDRAVAPPTEPSWDCCYGVWHLEDAACPAALSIHVADHGCYSADEVEQLRIAVWSDGSIVLRQESAARGGATYRRVQLDQATVRRAIVDAYEVIGRLARGELSCPGLFQVPVTNVYVCLSGQWRNLALPVHEPQADARCAAAARALDALNELLRPLEDAASRAPGRNVEFGRELTLRR